MPRTINADPLPVRHAERAALILDEAREGVLWAPQSNNWIYARLFIRQRGDEIRFSCHASDFAIHIPDMAPSWDEMDSSPLGIVEAADRILDRELFSAVAAAWLRQAKKSAEIEMAYQRRRAADHAITEMPKTLRIQRDLDQYVVILRVYGGEMCFRARHSTIAAAQAATERQYGKRTWASVDGDKIVAYSDLTIGPNE